MPSPLLEDHLLPPFSKISVDDIVPSIKQLLENNRQTIKETLDDNSNPNWEKLIDPLDKAANRLNKSWSPIGHMNAVVNSDELRQAYEACLPLLSEFYTEMGQNKDLYKAYVKLSESEDFNHWPPARKKIIEDELLDFRLSGIALPAEDQKRFGEIQKRLSKLSSEFSNHVLDATMAWTKLIADKDELQGLPDTALEAAAEAAQKKDLEGYLFTLEFPSYIPVMTYCANRQLRREMYEAFCTRASDQGPNAEKFDNSAIMEEILELRHEKIKLLGFNNYAEYSIATKMASTTAEVLGFLNDLAKRSKPKAENEFQEMKKFAAENLGLDDVHAWDSSFVAEKLRQHKYAISQEELRPYFAADRVISGMFDIASRLFDIQFEKSTDFDSWHKDVRFYKIHQNGQHIASFYLDPFAREHKRGGAWMDQCRSRMKIDGQLQLPVAYLVCNFSPPVGKKPALLTHDEVVTLFHEFGHGLHHMLTKVNEMSASGIQGVAWDAVELPSQFMENWCWEKEALDIIAEHYESGEKLPQEMVDKLLAAKNFNSALAMLRQLEYALFDFRIHCEYGTDQFLGIQGTLDDVRKQVAVIPAPEFNRFQHGFGHIFAGGYSAGYYSYKWAEVLSADAYSKFEETGIFNQQTGREFLENILEKGGSEKAEVLFEKFRGRKPNIDALLRHTGIQ